MARQPKQDKDTVTPAQEITEQSRQPLLESIFPKLLGFPNLQDPTEMVAALAKHYSKQHGFDRKRVQRCLQKLVEAETAAYPTRKVRPTTFLKDGFAGLLSRALACMKPQSALRFCETEDLAAYRQRVHAARVLANPFTPLYTLQELARLTASFLEHQEGNRDALLATGHPATNFGLSPWFDTFLNKLYYTKIPIALVEGRKTEGIGPGLPKPAYPKSYVDWRRPGVPVGSWQPYLFSFFGRRDEQQSEPFLPLGWTWARRRRSLWSTCSYEDADRIVGLNKADADRLNHLRANLFELKVTLLTRVHSALVSQDTTNLWPQSVALFIDRMRGDDADFLLQMDRVYASHDVKTGAKQIKPIPLMAGGLTSLLEFIGYIEKELTLGTLTKTRDSLSDWVNVDTLRRPRLTLKRAREPYLALAANGKSKLVREALDAFIERDTQEHVFWKGFRQRAAEVLEKELRVPVATLVPRKFLEALGPILQQQAALLTQRYVDGDLAMSTSPAPAQNVFRFTGVGYTVCFGEEPFALPNGPGYYYIAFLLEQPKKEFNASELRAAHTRFCKKSDERDMVHESDANRILEDCLRSEASDLGEVVDKVSVDAMYRKLREIKQDLEHADHTRNDMEKGLLTKLKAKLEDFLFKTHKPNGQVRKFNQRMNRDRNAVRNAIDRALEKIRKTSPPLYRHLRNSLHFKERPLFAYEPESPIRWVQ